jgi:hypothetical protein
MREYTDPGVDDDPGEPGDVENIDDFLGFAIGADVENIGSSVTIFFISSMVGASARSLSLVS